MEGSGRAYPLEPLHVSRTLVQVLQSGDAVTSVEGEPEGIRMFEKLPSDVDVCQHLLAELADDLEGRAARFKTLLALDADFGSSGGTLIFGGQPASMAYGEARASFAAGNYMATILLAQVLLEQLLAGFLHSAGISMSTKVTFRETLDLCGRHGLIGTSDMSDIERLSQIRNPLMHFRHLSDAAHIARRAISEDRPSIEICEEDARFAVALVMRLLGRPPFALR